MGLGPCASAPDFDKEQERFKNTKGAEWGNDIPPPRSAVVEPEELKKREAAVKEKEKQLEAREKALDEREAAITKKEGK